MKSIEFHSSIFLLLYALVFIMSPHLLAQRPFPSFKKHTVANDLTLAKKLFIADVDRDGNMDIVAAASNETNAPNVVIYFNDGDQTFTPEVLSNNYFMARGVYAGDFVSGGYLEIAAGSADGKKIVLWEYDSGTDSWTADSVGNGSAPNNYSIRAADVNDDGFLDILATLGPDTNGVYWFQGDGQGGFTQRIIATNYTNSVDLVGGDLDNEGDVDVAAAGFIDTGDNVSWWQNDGTPGDGGWIKDTIQANYNFPNSIELVDINNDGYLDVLSIEWGDIQSPTNNISISWWQNDGSGNFGTRQSVAENWYFHGRNARGADIDGDGDIDILACADDANRISWFENDGNQNFSEVNITTDFTYAYYVTGTDLDGDGDMDIIGSAQNANEVAWWENRMEDREHIASGATGPHLFWNDLVEISFNNGPNDTLRVFYNAGAVPDRQSLDAQIDHLAQRGFYTISTRASSYDGSVDFYYGAGNVPEWSAVDSPSDLVICLWDNTNSEWTIAGTSQSVDDVNQKITVNGITDEFALFSKWTLGSTTSDNPLPVQLLAFTAHSTNDGVKLQWTTASEINNLGYELWRAAKPDSGYVLLANYLTHEGLQGAGNSNRTIDYEFLDTDVQDGSKYYYRLVDVNFDNQKASHGPIEITYRSEALLARNYQLGQNFPNPFNGATRIPVHITGEGQGKKAARLILYDITGRQVRSFDLSRLSPGTNMIEWDGRDQFNRMVASGVYIYSLFANGEVQSKRLQFIK